MVVPHGVNPHDVLNKNIFYKNPTHLLEAEHAVNQSDIVKAILDNHRRARRHERFIYSEEGGNPRNVIPGMLAIREMEQEELEGLFKSILRLRPNIFTVRISLGEYPNTTQLNDRRVSLIGTSTPRRHTDTAKLIADAFADSRLRIVDFIYTITNAEIGTYNSIAYAYTTDAESYVEDAFFKPVLEIDYIDA